jgi:hypothetical protein
VILAALLVVALTAPAAWTWYLTRRMVGVATHVAPSRALRLAVVASAVLGSAILLLGVAAFALSGLDWLILLPIWSVALMELAFAYPGLRRSWLRTRP